MENFLLEMLAFVVALLAAIAGMVTHFYKRRMRGESISDDLFEYMIRFNPDATRRALLTTVITVITMWSTGQVISLAAEGLSLSAIATYFLAGYMIDSSINKELAD